MTPDARGPEHPEDHDPAEGESFHVSDKRRVHPDDASAAGSAPAAGGSASGDAAPSDEETLAGLDFEPENASAAQEAVAAAQAEAAQHKDALARTQAEYVNYRNRAKREADAARSRGVEDVLTGLLPVLDDVERARAAGDLTGPFAAISDKLDGVLARYGVERFGAVGEEFDPNLHHALMHQPDPDATSTTISMVIEPGYRIGDRVVRPANVAVTGPDA